MNQGTPSPLTDGSLVLPIDAAGLTYISGANGQPVVTADCQLNPYNSDSVPLWSVTATLSINGNTVGQSFYSAADATGNLASGVDYRFAVPVTSPLQTGQYSWTMTITENYQDSKDQTYSIPRSPVPSIS